MSVTLVLPQALAEPLREVVSVAVSVAQALAVVEGEPVLLAEALEVVDAVSVPEPGALGVGVLLAEAVVQPVME